MWHARGVPTSQEGTTLEGSGQAWTYARSSGSSGSFSPCTRRMYTAERSLWLVLTRLAPLPPPPSGPLS